MAIASLEISRPDAVLPRMQMRGPGLSGTLGKCCGHSSAPRIKPDVWSQGSAGPKFKTSDPESLARRSLTISALSFNSLPTPRSSPRPGKKPRPAGSCSSTDFVKTFISAFCAHTVSKQHRLSRALLSQTTSLNLNAKPEMSRCRRPVLKSLSYI